MILYASLICFISFIYLIKSQLLITSSPYTSLEEYNTIFYNNIFNNSLLEYLNKMQIKGLEAITSKGNLQIKTIKMTSYTILPNTPAHGGFKDNMIIFAPNYITLTFEFKASINNSPPTSGFFNLDLYYILIKESAIYSQDNPDIKIPNVQVTIRTKESGFNFYKIEETDEKSIELYKVIIKSFFFSVNKEIIQNAFKEAINEKQKEKYTNLKPIPFTSTPICGSISGRLIMNDFIDFCKDMNGKRETIQCYYSGNYKKLYTNKQKDASFNKNFHINNNREKIFINFILFDQLLEDISEKKPISILSNDTLPDDQREFNVSYIKTQFLISGDYLPGTLFEVHSQIESIKLDNSMSLIPIGIVTFVNSIIVKTELSAIIVQFTTELGFDIELISKISMINLCAKNIKIKSISDIKLAKVINEQSLILEIERIINKVNNNTKGCLINDYLNLNDYLKYVEEMEIGYRGIYIEGEQIDNLIIK